MEGTGNQIGEEGLSGQLHAVGDREMIQHIEPTSVSIGL